MNEPVGEVGTALRALAARASAKPGARGLEAAARRSAQPGSSLERYGFHATHAQDGRAFQVATEPLTIDAGAVCQFVMISAALAMKLRCQLDLKAVDFNFLPVHKFGSSDQNQTPIAAWKGPHAGP